MAKGTGAGVVKQGGTDWYFLTADYVFGQALERDTAAVVKASGGARPRGGPPSAQHAGFLVLPAPGAGFEGEDPRPRQRRHRHHQRDQAGAGIRPHRQHAARGAHRLPQRRPLARPEGGAGPAADGGLLLGPERGDPAWSRRFFARMKRMPSMTQAGAYSGTLHYLKAVKAVGSKDPEAVMAQMRRTPINDFMTHDGVLRRTGGWFATCTCSRQDPDGIDRRMGPLQARAPHPGQRGVPPARRGRMPAGAMNHPALPSPGPDRPPERKPIP